MENRIFQYYLRNAPAEKQQGLGPLLLAEGHAVGALIHGRVLLVGTHHDPVQRAVVCGIAVVRALRNGALNALVGIAAHGIQPPSSDFLGSFPRKFEIIHLLIDFFLSYRYNRCGKIQAEYPF